MKQIRTNTDHHYISTTWLDALGYYETMAFKRPEHDEIDWEEIATIRANEENEAILNHCITIQQIVAMETEK